MNRTEHLLVCLMEECSEVQKAAAKALRFGLDDKEPGQDQTNAERISDEMLDALSVIEMLKLAGALPRKVRSEMISAHEAKVAKVERFMRYAEERGTIRRTSPKPLQDDADAPVSVIKDAGPPDNAGAPAPRSAFDRNGEVSRG